ncbi:MULTISPECIES: amidase [unclassified Martelella]|uniref:amidase n=1 Tax=unclassified Martelella TaxID=2629616 RepID=UPI0025C6E654|nr:amidase [Martelella sp.]
MNLANEIHWLPAWRLRECVVHGEISAEEIARRLLERIANHDGGIHSFLTVAGEMALDEARAIDRRIAAGDAVGALAGVPVTIKDQFLTRGLRTTGGSKALENHIPDHDSVYAARIREAGGIILGKTNTPEFGMYWRTVGLIAEECRNPWDLKRTSGGSSGGAAAALASGFGPLAIGSDSGGSIRLPAAQCGILGLLPSYGRVPRHGGFGSAMFFSAIGPMARDVRDAATLLQVIADPLTDDPFCRTDPPPDYLARLDDGISGVRAAWWDNTVAAEFSDPDVIATVRAAADRIVEFGALLSGASVVLDTDMIDETWRVLDFVDRHANLGEELMRDPETAGKLTPYARTRFEWADQVSGAQYSRAVMRRARFVRHLDAVFAETDLLLSPTMGITSPVVNPNDITQRIPALVSYTLPVNVAGYCAASVPCGFVNGLPVGLQIIGRPNEEDLVLRASRQYEKALNWNARHPEGEMDLAS